MNRHYFFIIVIIALACLFLIFFSLGKKIEEPVTKEMITPPLSPYKSYISGVGIVEPESGNISIGIPVNRLVDQVLVKVGSKVRKGDILLRLEDKDLQANLKVQQAAYESALAKLQKLRAFPRSEDLAEAKANLEIAQIESDLAKKQYEMILDLPDPRSISTEEKNRRYSALQQAQAKLQQAQANWDKTKSGTWKPDLEIARTEVEEAKAHLNEIKAEIERHQIKSPIDATVLQVKVHNGELPPLDTFRTPIMVLGNSDELYLRVSINQLDIPYYNSDAPAVAFLQGDAKVEFPLEFVRVEPLLVNKQNFTNEITERVDTRVLQILYKLKKEDFPLFVGEQMDVFIRTKFSS